jgi:hypothetical protein
MLSLSRRATFISLVGSCLLAGACVGGMLKSLRDLATLRQKLIDKYHEPDINVSTRNSRALLIVFVNSPLNQKQQLERARRAQETATFAVANYPGINRMESIVVSFIEAETHFFVYHYSRGLGFFVFDRTGTALHASGFESTSEESGDPRKPVARFSASRNETDVSITRLQLEGDMNQGIALVPHFTFKGSVGNPSGVAPDWVVFDFASYADRKIFPTSARLDIRCDEVLVFSGGARLLSPEDSGSEGSPAQFLTAQIPFSQFSQIGKAKKVKIKLGSKNFDLSPEDIESLRAMSAYSPPPQEQSR